jgi:outer membrane immunogenic protein
MGFRKLQTLIVVLALVASTNSFAQNSTSADTTAKVKKTKATAAKAQAKTQAPAKRVDVEKDLDTLGGNDALLQKATALDPENRSRIVQKRIVDRENRLELGVNYGGVAGGDPYLKTQNIGAAADFHINPRWSLGLRYFDYGNDLTSEGSRMLTDARARYDQGGRTYVIPDIDYPIQSAMAVVDFYPIYGKTNLLDMAIAQFDMYMLAGGGQIQLSSGWTTTYTAGIGIGFWVGQHMTLRTELRYQNYKDQIITGSRTINAIVGTAGIGFML